MLRTSAIVLVFAFAFSAHAVGLPELRERVAAAASKADGARGRRIELERALGEVAGRIERIKSDRAIRGGMLFGDAQLDDLLKRSQALSEELNTLMRSEREAEEALRASQSGLAGGIDLELDALRAQWDAGGSSESRRALLPRMKTLRSERDSLRGWLPAAKLPRLDEQLGDDPEELLERADALLDGEDKLRREERALAERIGVLREERELERRMHDFLGQELLFDEHDRRISVSRRVPVAAGELGTGAPPKAGGLETQPSPPAGDPGAVEPSVGYDGSQSPGLEPGPAAGSMPGRHDEPAPVVDVLRSGISRAPPERRGAFSPWSEDETIEQLEARRSQLGTAADALHRSAEETLRRARELR